MKKIALIYWPGKGNVEMVANQIFKKFDNNIIDIYTITNISIEELSKYEFFIVGCSTTGADTWQDAHKTEWNDFFRNLEKADFKNKTIALFGLGDQILYPSHFVDYLAVLKEEFEKQGAKIVGYWSTKGYEFNDSKAVINDQFVGLVIDEDKQTELTEERIEQWTTIIKDELGGKM